MRKKMHDVEQNWKWIISEEVGWKELYNEYG